jgi:hypothetical protein
VGEETFPPQLIADGNLKRCSVCGCPFPAEVHPSISVAFAEHLLKAHKPGQTSEDASQAAVRMVREATEREGQKRAAFTSAFQELDPIPQYKATAKLAGFLQSVHPS